MNTLLNIAALIAHIASIVFFIIVLVKIFKDNILLGILGLFIPIFTYIYGWVKSDSYGIQKTMLHWTIAIVVSAVLLSVTS